MICWSCSNILVFSLKCFLFCYILWTFHNSPSLVSLHRVYINPMGLNIIGWVPQWPHHLKYQASERGQGPNRSRQRPLFPHIYPAAFHYLLYYYYLRRSCARAEKPAGLFKFNTKAQLLLLKGPSAGLHPPLCSVPHQVTTFSEGRTDSSWHHSECHSLCHHNVDRTHCHFHNGSRLGRHPLSHIVCLDSSLGLYGWIPWVYVSWCHSVVINKLPQAGGIPGRIILF